MRPRRIPIEYDLILLKAYEKVKADEKKRRSCNQYQIAKKLREILEYSDYWSNITPLDRKRNADYFEENEYDLSQILHAIYYSSPAAIVQRIKRIKKSGT